ncbi:leukocyte receptor cluster member 8 homolog isoform X1 [Cimex lectularius]|uniref:PCI domain-containing protein n=2 Tax=Cimex lectularius TaxID=79782 RepID=A0A8I6TE75_CIMLE|nr:leukocyte receptor cluster member 8 homolog isoform X1 [Cimex lectularius]
MLPESYSLMSVMSDKNAAQPPHQQQQQQQQPQQQPWSYNMNMYNMYQSPYMYPQGYGTQEYYQFYARMQAAYMNQQQSSQQYRGFVSQGPMVPFQNIAQTTQPAAQENKEKEETMSELPPLPPGPPPPQQNGFVPVQNQDQNNIQAARSFPQNNTGNFQQGPIRFMMNVPRPRINLNPTNPFNQNQGRPQGQNQTAGQKKNKKKKKKQQQQNQAHVTPSFPPLPSAMPPLPPSPPPPPPPPVLKENQNEIAKQPPPLPPLSQQNLPQQQGIRALEEWPLSLRDYVNRCYAKCVTQMDKDRVGVILKGKLMRATNDGTLWVKDWYAEPLPLLDSDSKAMLNLKEKLKTSLAGRLGPKQKSPSPPKRRQTKRTYRSDSSSSRSSSDSYDRDRSRSPSPRSPKKPRNNLNKKGPRNQKKHTHYNTPVREKSHFYSEFGLMNNEDMVVKKEVLDKRAARFNNVQGQAQQNIFAKRKPPVLFVYDTGFNSSPNPMGDFDISDLHIVGTCEDLEKSYLRLTSAPEASQVRPPYVLIKALDMVKKKWSAERDYHYACEQLKSIRQDLTVQGIRDNLSVEVYETHARIALEKGDHAEFNQCQSQLRILHNEVEDGKSNREEFIAYRLLYYIFTKEFMDMNTLMSSLKDEDKKDDCISHAVQVSKAWLIGSFHKIFKLYKTAPRMSSYLMDLFMLRERTLALKVIVKAYRPSIPVDFLRSELAFETDSELEEFLTSFGGLVFVDDTKTKLDCKASSVALNVGA